MPDHTPDKQPYHPDAPRIKRVSSPVAARPIDNTQNYEDTLALGVRTKTKRPSQYKVLLLNDNFTPMDFVVYVLERVFRKTRTEATDIMLQIHNRGVGVAGIFTYEIAETKVDQTMALARKHEHPLQCTLEREE